MRRALVVALVMACKRDAAVTLAPAASTATIVTATPAPRASVSSYDAHVELKNGGLTLFDATQMRDAADLTAHARAASTAQKYYGAEIRADSAVRYQRVIETMDALRDGGITDVTFGRPLD